MTFCLIVVCFFFKFSLYRRMIRSTLILIPLFGVYYVISVTMPDCMDDTTEIVWLYVESIINSFQVSIFLKNMSILCLSIQILDFLIIKSFFNGQYLGFFFNTIDPLSLLSRNKVKDCLCAGNFICHVSFYLQKLSDFYCQI